MFFRKIIRYEKRKEKEMRKKEETSTVCTPAAWCYFKKYTTFGQ